MKYAVLNIDTECGGEAFFTTIDSEKELKEVIGSYTTYKKLQEGLELFNDGEEEDFRTAVILNKKGLEKVVVYVDKKNGDVFCRFLDEEGNRYKIEKDGSIKV